MLRKFYATYKHRKAAIIIRLIVLIIFAPFAAKAVNSLSVEESEYLPSNVESIEGEHLMESLFSNVSLGGNLQLVITGELTWEDYLELRSLAEKFVQAGYADNFSTPIEKSLQILTPYGAYLSGQAVYENGTITAMYLPVEVYVGVRISVYQVTGNHTLASNEALSNATLISQGLSQALGGRTIIRINTFHQIRYSTDPSVLITNPMYYADVFVHQMAPNFGPYVSAGANYTNINTRKYRDNKINSLLNATVPATSAAINEPQNVIYDLFTRPIDYQEISQKAFEKGYVKAMIEGNFAPSGIPPKALRTRLGISNDGTTAYADLTKEDVDEQYYRDVRDRWESIEKPDNVKLTGVGLMWVQISDEAKKRTRFLHYADVIIIMIVLAIILRAVPASVGPVLIIGSAVVLAEGALYWMHEIFDVAITEISLTVMVTAMLGAGVDYAVFMSSRYVEERGRGKSKDEAVMAAIEHAGRSLLTSGGTIAIAFGVLALSSFKTLQGLGIAVAFGIGMSVLAALVLMPAVFGALGDKFFRPRRMHYKPSRFYKVGRRVLKHRKAVLLSIVVVFGAFSYVALQAETSYDMIALMPDVPAKDGVKTLIDKFGSFMMPVLVLVHVDDESQISAIDDEIMSVDGVVNVRSYAHPLGYTIEIKTLFRQMVAEKIREGLYKDGRSLHIVTIAYNPFTRDAFNVVKNLRSELSEHEKYVTGVAAMYYDISQLVDKDFDRLSKIVIVAIVIFLTIVFGSFLIPLRLEGTVLLNIGGTLGIVYLILKAFNEPLGRIIPITLFVVLNGLGMDYDIFLVTRIMEERAKGLSDNEAIVEAVANTMRVITACGIIMASSFGMLLITKLPIVVQIGLGLAMAVIFDTFVMRAFFVPAFMSLAGKRNRRAPKALKKLAVYKVE